MSRTADVAIAGAIFNILPLHLSMFSAPQRPYAAVCGARTGWAWGGFPAVWSPIGPSTGVVVAEESGAANFGFGVGADLWGQFRDFRFGVVAATLSDTESAWRRPDRDSWLRGSHVHPLCDPLARARCCDDCGRRRRDASYGVARDSHPVSTIR
jgi:hypothetical protein